MSNKISINSDSPKKVEVTATPGNITVTDASNATKTVQVAQGVVAGGQPGAAGATGTFQFSYGSSPPASPDVGDIWFNSGDGVFVIYLEDTDSKQWVEWSGKQGVTGATGGIDGTTLIHALGISTDKGITFPDGTHQTTAGAGAYALEPLAQPEPLVQQELLVLLVQQELLVQLARQEQRLVRLVRLVQQEQRVRQVQQERQVQLAQLVTPEKQGATGFLQLDNGLTLTTDGVTLSIDPTAVIHIAGISSDGGATFGGEVRLTQIKDFDGLGNIVFTGDGGGRISMEPGSGGNYIEMGYSGTPDQNGVVVLYPIVTHGRMYAKAGISAEGGMTLNGVLNLPLGDGSNPATTIKIPTGGKIVNQQADPPSVSLLTNKVALASKGTGSPGKISVDNNEAFIDNVVLKTEAGISMDNSGITFPDGTHQSSASSGSISEITDSYVGNIESASNKTFFVDPRTVAERTMTEFFAFAASGGCTLELHGNGNSMGTIVLNSSSQGVTGATTQSALTNTTIPAGGTLQFNVSGNTLARELQFAIGFTQ